MAYIKAYTELGDFGWNPFKSVGNWLHKEKTKRNKWAKQHLGKTVHNIGKTNARIIHDAGNIISTPAKVVYNATHHHKGGYIHKGVKAGYGKVSSGHVGKVVGSYGRIGSGHVGKVVGTYGRIGVKGNYGRVGVTMNRSMATPIPFDKWLPAVASELKPYFERYSIHDFPYKMRENVKKLVNVLYGHEAGKSWLNNGELINPRLDSRYFARDLPFVNWAHNIADQVWHFVNAKQKVGHVKAVRPPQIKGFVKTGSYKLVPASLASKKAKWNFLMHESEKIGKQISLHKKMKKEHRMLFANVLRQVYGEKVASEWLRGNIWAIPKHSKLKYVKIPTAYLDSLLRQISYLKKKYASYITHRNIDSLKSALNGRKGEKLKVVYATGNKEDIGSSIIEARKNGVKNIVVVPSNKDGYTYKIPTDLQFNKVIVKTKDGKVLGEYDKDSLIANGILKPTPQKNVKKVVRAIRNQASMI